VKQAGLLPRALIIALIMTGLGAMIIALRISSLAEAASSRTQLLVILAGTGCFITAFLGALISGWLSRRLPAILVLLVSFVLAIPAFIGGFALSFAVHNRYIVGQFESPAFSRHWFHEVVFSPAAAVGMFLQTGTKYLLPWPAPLIAGIFTVLIALAFLRK
jgi:MFS-type transporter involved in bile tolerance (Atg22 family)